MVLSDWSSSSDTTVKRHIKRLFRETGWTDAGQGWEGKDGELSLMGWQKRRRVVVLRRPLMGEIMITEEEDGQQLLAFVEADRKSRQRNLGSTQRQPQGTIQHSC